MTAAPASDSGFTRLVEQWRGEHLGPDKDEGVGLLWKEGGYVELLAELYRVAPRTMAALADRLVALDHDNTLMSAFMTAFRQRGTKRREALEALDLYVPNQNLSDVLDTLEPPMPRPFRDRIEAWLDLARGIEIRTSVPPPGTLKLSDALRRDLVRLREHLGRSTPPSVQRSAIEGVQAELGCAIPLDVLGLLAALHVEPRHLLDLGTELEEFHAANEQPDWKRLAGFDHVPFLAQGDWPRSYACFPRDEAPVSLRLFDLKTGTFDPTHLDMPTLLRRLWPDADWDRQVPESDLEAFAPEIVDIGATNRVCHPKFGEGEVVEDLGDRAKIRFDDGQVRTMLLRFLQRVE